MAKGKKKVGGSGGPHKNHGPKRHLHRWCGAMKQDFARAGVLSKYHDYESWQIACAARGKRSVTQQEFEMFVILPMEKKKEYFTNIKKR